MLLLASNNTSNTTTVTVTTVKKILIGIDPGTVAVIAVLAAVVIALWKLAEEL